MLPSVPPILVLFGLRGSGKTTLGRLLSMRLGCPFIDLDERVRLRLGGANLASAFRAAGEPAFRAAECAELDAVLQSETGRAVLALGGGTPTHAPSRDVLTAAQHDKRVRLVLLEAAPAVLGARVSAAPGDRPLLAGATFVEEANVLSERRLPTYRALAEHTVRTDQPTAQALAELEAVAG